MKTVKFLFAVIGLLILSAASVSAQEPDTTKNNNVYVTNNFYGNNVGKLDALLQGLLKNFTSNITYDVEVLNPPTGTLLFYKKDTLLFYEEDSITYYAKRIERGKYYFDIEKYSDNACYITLVIYSNPKYERIQCAFVWEKNILTRVHMIFAVENGVNDPNFQYVYIYDGDHSLSEMTFSLEESSILYEYGVILYERESRKAITSKEIEEQLKLVFK